VSVTLFTVSAGSTRIGRSLAIELGRGGHRVVATARAFETLKDLPVALRLALDVTDQASVDAAVPAAVSRFGRIDTLVKNAGFAMRAAVEEIDEGVAKMVIVHVGSAVGRFTFPVNGAYAASKHALVALSDTMRLELCPFGVGVAIVKPGTIDTSFITSFMTTSC
jgi:NAD(P)-dependent dehydrogenase (short-subunit alcohol dehydrogenase family)